MREEEAGIIRASKDAHTACTPAVLSLLVIFSIFYIAIPLFLLHPAPFNVLEYELSFDIANNSYFKIVFSF